MYICVRVDKGVCEEEIITGETLEEVFKVVSLRGWDFLNDLEDDMVVYSLLSQEKVAYFRDNKWEIL